MLHRCQAAGRVKKAANATKCANIVTLTWQEMKDVDSCLPVPFIMSIWKHVFRDQTLFNFFFVCVFYIVLRLQKCVFSPVYHSQGSKRNTFLRAMLWWVGKEIENVSYHFCRALIFNYSVPCIIYCLRLLLIHDWFGNKQSCHHSCLPARAKMSNFWATRHKSLFCVNKVTAMTLPPSWIQAVCKWNMQSKGKEASASSRLQQLKNYNEDHFLKHLSTLL